MEPTYCLADCTVPPLDMLSLCNGDKSRAVARILLDHLGDALCGSQLLRYQGTDCTLPPLDMLSACTGGITVALPVLKTCPLHAKSGRGKERRILTGPKVGRPGSSEVTS